MTLPYLDSDGLHLWGAVELAPRDQSRKLVLADWFEERGDTHWAFTMRWLAKHGRWPGPREWYQGRLKPFRIPSSYSWCWHREYPDYTHHHLKPSDNGEVPRLSILPVTLFAALPDCKLTMVRRLYPQCALALVDLCEALAVMREVLRT